MSQTPHKRIVQGRVIARAGNKSIVILVARKVVHPKYRKIVNRFKKYIVHDEENKANIGDEIVAIESKPIAKSKSFCVREIISVGV